MGEHHSVKSTLNRQLGYVRRPQSYLRPGCPPMRLGHHAEAYEGMALALQAGYELNPRAFRQPKPGMLTPVERLGLRHGVLKTDEVGLTDPPKSQTEEGLQRRAHYDSMTLFTDSVPHPRHLTRRRRLALGLSPDPSPKELASDIQKWNELRDAVVTPLPSPRPKVNQRRLRMKQLRDAADPEVEVVTAGGERVKVRKSQIV